MRQTTGSKSGRHISPRSSSLPLVGGGGQLLWTAALVVIGSSSLAVWWSSSAGSSSPPHSSMPVVYHLLLWSLAQWLPSPWCHHISDNWQNKAWAYWETTNEDHKHHYNYVLDIPTVQVQDYVGDPRALLHHLESTFGRNWRQRPLLLQGLWPAANVTDTTTTAAAAAATSRRLSRDGLLQEELVVPYFYDARVVGALTPNDHGPIRDIVANITLRGAPHKIGTQLVLETYPELIREVAPHDIVTTLFGNHFEPHHVVGAFGMAALPALTTVPLFVAGTTRTRTTNATPRQRRRTSTEKEHAEEVSQSKQAQDGGKSQPEEESQPQSASASPFTGLHCEPIGNVAVQLEGAKQWTLVSPQHSWHLKPSISPDGRAFFVSLQPPDNVHFRVPHYVATTKAGDAMWVPTWTWHRVDYFTTKTTSLNPKVDKAEENEEDSNSLAIGASLFHLRPKELLTHNPLFALLVVPNLLKEVLGFNTQ